MTTLPGTRSLGFFMGLFSGIVNRRLVPGIATILFLGYLVSLGWMTLGPRKPAPDSARMRLAGNAIDKMADQLRESRGNLRQAILLHFANDPTDFFTTRLQEKLDSTGILMLEDRPLSEKIRLLMNLRMEGCNSREQAITKAKNSGVDAVLWGMLTHFESYSAGAIVKGSWELVDLKTGEVTARGEILEDGTSTERESLAKAMGKVSDTVHKNAELMGGTIGQVPWYVRFLGFVLLVLLLPILTIAFIRFMVAKRQNKVNGFMLGIYTVIDAILAFFMVGGVFDSCTTVCVFLTATLLACYYNYLFMCYALKLES